MRYTPLLAAALIAAITTGCATDESDSGSAKKSETPKSEGTKMSDTPDSDPVTSLRAAIVKLESKKEHTAPKIVVQHILIGFEGSVPGKGITRTRDEAEALSASIFDQIQKGTDFDGLVKKHTDDSYPGKYPMAASGRSGMVQGFGDVGWRLEVDEVGVAPYHTAKSPYGWHIIKRVE